MSEFEWFGAPMIYQLEPSVRDEIARLFNAADVEYVVSKLQSTKLTWESSAPPPRVHIAILWQSKGDLKQFDSAIREACSDWRNTLIWNGLGDDDWHQVLGDAGVECSGW